MGAGPEIVLVGVVHGDPEGYERLGGVLQREQPQAISLEISEYSWRYRRIWAGRWRRQFELGQAALAEADRGHMAVERIRAQIACPFEVRAVEAYAREQGVAWLAVDIQSVAREHLPRYAAELLRAENLRALVRLPDGDWADEVRQEYHRARTAVETGRGGMIKLWGEALSPRVTVREKVLAHRVARMARRWGKVVHVGGWEHLVLGGTRKTMGDYLAGWRPRRVLLDER